MTRYLVLGGTGTLGREIIKNLLIDNKARVICFSRDEFKQFEMKKAHKGNDQLRFILGDIREKDSLNLAMEGVHTVFHVAALKQIDTMEDNPIECKKTNIDGTINVAEAAIRAKVPHVVFSSTDKAVLPINAYGMAKAFSEKVLLHKNRTQTTTKFCIFRWGNVLASRGSVVHSFEQSLKAEGKAYLTDKHMTRFWIRIEDAVKFMLSSYQGAPRDQIMIPEMKGAHVTSLVKAIADCLQIKSYEVAETGIRPGEKINETIDIDHRGLAIASNTVGQYTHPELMKLIKYEIART